VVHEACPLCVGYQPLLPRVESGEDFLVADNVEVLQLLNELLKPGIFIVRRVSLNRRWAHVHVIGQQSYIFAGHYIVLVERVWVLIALSQVVRVILER
jgi:hypothetical protein